jgi:hypothetical protein
MFWSRIRLYLPRIRLFLRQNNCIGRDYKCFGHKSICIRHEYNCVGRKYVCFCRECNCICHDYKCLDHADNGDRPIHRKWSQANHGFRVIRGLSPVRERPKSASPLLFSQAETAEPRRPRRPQRKISSRSLGFRGSNSSSTVLTCAPAFAMSPAAWAESGLIGLAADV